jgi:hypothetical protein
MLTVTTVDHMSHVGNTCYDVSTPSYLWKPSRRLAMKFSHPGHQARKLHICITVGRLLTHNRSSDKVYDIYVDYWKAAVGFCPLLRRQMDGGDVNMDKVVADVRIQFAPAYMHLTINTDWDRGMTRSFEQHFQT